MSDGDTMLKEVELGDVEEQRLPRRIIHFASGETMEEYSTEEEEEGEEEKGQRIDFSKVDTGCLIMCTTGRVREETPQLCDRVKWDSGSAETTCDFLGGKLATMFGLNSPKYQYAIDEYKRAQEEDSDEEGDGHYIPGAPEKNVLREREQLQMQSLEYGTIQSQETSQDTEETYHVYTETSHSDPTPTKE
ncbi:protein FAM177B [Hyperolius riggenbachi]|uniref:protein FAM177B n=1 Tax=Hyperolius riggenbachi TaxID=752182 RepID=UPI0035A386A8